MIRTEKNKITHLITYKKSSEQRLMTVYDKKKKVEGKYYNKNSFVAESAVVSSDGWCVLFTPNYFLGQEKNWELIDYVGNSYQIEKIVYDKTNKLLYVKIPASGLRVMSFANWQNVEINTNVWSIGFADDWQANLLANILPRKEKIVGYYSDTQYIFSLSEMVSVSNILVDSNGQLLAFVDDDGQGLLPSWQVEKGINSVLEFGKLQFLDVGWQGSFVYGVFGNNNSQPKQVYKMVKNQQIRLQVGDMFLEIKTGQLTNFSRTNWFAPVEFKITIWRDN
jgi:hypothetical protein